MSKDKNEEIIIVVPRVALFDHEKLHFQGTESDPDNVQKIMDNINSNFGIMKRGLAEKNKMFKQPIPYTVIRQGDKIFTYKRLKGGGESKLHESFSIGVGGHMNIEKGNDNFYDNLDTNMERELEEELNISEGERDVTILGFINDDSEVNDGVGKVHIGILVIIDIGEDVEVSVNETDNLEGYWFTVEELLEEDVYDSLESWSQIAVNTIK